MKKILFFLFIAISVTARTQECEYKVRVENEDGSVTRLTKEKVFYYQANPLKTDLVYLSLYTENGLSLVFFKYSRDSKSFPPAICIDKNSRLSFQLVNGKVISLTQVGEESCGYVNNLEGLDKQNNTVESFFYITDEALKELKQSKVTMMGLRTPTDKKDFVIASELELGPKEIIKPGRYFIENLECIKVQPQS